MHRRDSLLAFLWPELPADRARAALRKTLYDLRRHLGADALTTHGDDGVAINPSRFRIDATDFHRYLARHDHRAALRLYRGDLLVSF